MTQFTIDTRGLEEIERAINRTLTPDAMTIILGPPMVATMIDGQQILAKYPTLAPGAFKRLATPGQKRAFFAKLRAGEWTGRTGTLGRSWTFRAEPISGGYRGIIGNNTTYAVYVQSAAQQQPFHAESKWSTDAMAIEEMNKTGQKHLDRAIGQALSAAGLK